MHQLRADGSDNKDAGSGASDSEAEPELQILLVGCSGAGKTVLSRQLNAACGSGTDMTDLQLIKAAGDVRCSVLTSTAALLRHVYEFIPQSQHDIELETLRALLMWVVEIRLQQPLSESIGACVHSRDDSDRVQAASELARRLADAFEVDVRDIQCPTLEETPQLACHTSGERSSLRLTFVLCVAGDDDARGPIEAKLRARMLDTKEALEASVGAKEVIVCKDPEDVVRYLCPSDPTDVAFAEKWACVRHNQSVSPSGFE
eukprot:COSAG02_NODE_3653_length_6413_cov_4.685144_2_plen_260_part_00